MTGDDGVSTDAMVLAAGLGTRLRPLTNLLPKPLVPIGDRPALGHLVGALREAGFNRVVVNAHHLAPALARYAAEEPLVALSFEQELLGTAGGVRHARDGGLLRSDRLLVVNGDLFARLPVFELASATCAGVARLLVAPARGAGNVGVDCSGRVVRLRQETVGPDESHAFDYLGCALLGPASLAALPHAGCLVGDVLLPLLRAGAFVEVQVFEQPWLDVGGLGAYLEANRVWLLERGLERFVGEAVNVQDATISGSVVGARAELERGVHLDRCVVWPGARVPEGAHVTTIFAPGIPPVDAAALRP